MMYEQYFMTQPYPVKLNLNGQENTVL